MSSTNNLLQSAPSSVKAPKVSVIIPTFNNARFLPEALESVFSQNYVAYEVIVVDDGSTDETTAVLHPYASQIRYLWQPNAGSAVARNTGLNIALGEYVVFLDADDLLLPGKLREQAAYLDIRPLLGIVHSGWRIIDEDSHTVLDVTPWLEAPVLDLDTWLRRKPVKMGAMMIRRVWLESVGGLDPELRQSHDVDLMLRLSLAGCQTEWIYRPTLCYRHHKTSTIRRNALKQAQYATRVLDKFFTHPKIPVAQARRENQTRYFSSVWLAWHLYRSGFSAESKEYLEQSLRYSDRSALRTVMDWINHFIKWSLADGLNLSDLQQMWPSFYEASDLSERDCLALQRFMEWRLTRLELDEKIEIVEEKVFWQLIGTVGKHGSEHQIGVDLFLDWWVQVWQLCITAQGTGNSEAMANFNDVSPENIASLMQLSIVAQPGAIGAEGIQRIWHEALRVKLIPKEYKADITRLYLTCGAQALLGGRWRKATQCLLRALLWTRAKRGRQAWRQFVRNGWVYYRHGRTRTHVARNSDSL